MRRILKVFAHFHVKRDSNKKGEIVWADTTAEDEKKVSVFPNFLLVVMLKMGVFKTIRVDTQFNPNCNMKKEPYLSGRVHLLAERLDEADRAH